MARKPAIICDLDGTLASCEWRRHFIEDPTGEELGPRNYRQDWASFNAGIPFDAVVPEVLAKVRQAKAEGYIVLITSGRKTDRRQATRMWLEKHDVPFDLLFMRSSKDNRFDSVVKEELYRTFIEPHFDVHLVIDDRDSVCEMWERIGLNLMRVTDPCLPGPFGAPDRAEFFEGLIRELATTAEEHPAIISGVLAKKLLLADYMRIKSSEQAGAFDGTETGPDTREAVAIRVLREVAYYAEAHIEGVNC